MVLRECKQNDITRTMNTDNKEYGNFCDSLLLPCLSHIEPDLLYLQAKSIKLQQIGSNFKPID